MPTGHQTTVTAKIGAGVQATATTLKNVVEVHLFPTKKIIQIVQEDGPHEYDLNGVTTVTCTISGGNYAVTLP